MGSDHAMLWALIAVFLFAGLGFLFAKVDGTQVRKLESLNRYFPATRLYQFRVFRYGVAMAFFVMAGVVYLQLPS